MKETKYYTKAIAWASKKGFSSIKAKIEDFETPTSYASPNKELEYTPDITGKKRTKKSYFEIVEKTENVSSKVSKWKLLSTLAAMKGGDLILFAPRGNKAFTERLIKKHNLNAKLVYLPSI